MVLSESESHMSVMSFMNSETFTLVAIPILIFAARLCDVTLGTMRLVLVAKGIKFAPLVGFFEVLIWILAVGVILQNLTSIVNYVAYAGGFATGNYIGMAIGKKMVMGYYVVQVITNKDPSQPTERLKGEGYGITTVNGHGRDGPVKILYVVLRRENIKEVLDIIEKFDKDAFYSIEDLQGVSKSPSLRNQTGMRKHIPWVIQDRKGK